MRWDITGLFWDDYVAPRQAVVREKRQPPEATWLAPDYLPHWEEASAFELPEATDEEVTSWAGKHLVWDTEFYENYALIGFLEPDSGKVASFERVLGEPWSAPLGKLIWIVRNCVLVGFNDTLFDTPMLHAALDGMETDQLADAADLLINGAGWTLPMRPKELYKHFKLPNFPINNIDLIELTPLSPGLKTCAGRMHAERMADLPFQPGTSLSGQQIIILRWYWFNDLQNTKQLWGTHKTAIGLRELLTAEYSTDVRSKSDPQIAEAVIRVELTRLTGRRYFPRATIVPWRSFQYQPPAYLKFATQNMQWVLWHVCQQRFVIDQAGSPMMPDALSSLDVPIGNSLYRMGIGGLHSKEKRTIHVAGEEFEITDNDVTSYYPSMMLQQGMYPPNVGPEFIQVFRRIVERRVAAKKALDTGTAETLKIVANGTFGKTGERNGYSIVYHPEMMIQVTVTGQLSLLLLIERLELAGIPVISANTDGIIVKCPKQLTATRDAIMKQWEKDTGLELESKAYKAVYSRDVNNYVALYDEPNKKAKGAYQYAKAVGAYRQTIDVYPLKWNPTCEVCSEALITYLATGTPIEETIRACTDVRKFLEVRRATGGACKDGEYLGKAIRWYYSTETRGQAILNAKTGHDIPRSQGAKPCMVLPKAVPVDLDYEYYIDRALGLLSDFQPKKTRKEEKEVASAA